MISLSKIQQFIEPTKERGSSVSLFFGTVIGIDGSTLIIETKAGGVVYATSYVYCKLDDLVACLAFGTSIIAFAAKDAKRLEDELGQSGLIYHAGEGIKIDSASHTISADVTEDDLAGKANTKHSHSATDITSGTLDKARLPSIPANKLEGTIPTDNLPSFVDDVIEGTLSTFPATGETGKIYVDTTTNKTYRWSGSKYVEISASLALGETSSTAYRGDRGKVAYDHTTRTDNPHKVTAAQVGAAASSHKHSAADVTSGTLPVARGGTGATTRANAIHGLFDNTTFPVTSASDDLPSKWVAAGTGQYRIDSQNYCFGLPLVYAYLLNFVCKDNRNVFQIIVSSSFSQQSSPEARHGMFVRNGYAYQNDPITDKWNKEDNGYRGFRRIYTDDAQSIADLIADAGLDSKYLKLTGGVINGDLTAGNKDDTTSRTIAVNRKVGSKGINCNFYCSNTGNGAATVIGLRDTADLSKYLNRLRLNENSTDLMKPLTVASGGTGGTTAKAASFNLLKGANEETSTMSDNYYFGCFYSQMTEGNGAIHKKKASHVWPWIKSKADPYYKSTLNGKVVNAPSWYAPRTVGQMGQYLVSSGTGEPVWVTVEGGVMVYPTGYPVGSVYLTFDSNFNPAKTFGGSWTKNEETYLFLGITIWRCVESPDKYFTPLDLYPIGTAFLTFDEDRNPASEFGGTWTLNTETYLFLGIKIYKRIS